MAVGLEAQIMGRVAPLLTPKEVGDIREELGHRAITVMWQLIEAGKLELTRNRRIHNTAQPYFPGWEDKPFVPF